MSTADQIAEINAQYAERVKLLQAERDAKVAMVQGRCKHELVPATVKINGKDYMVFGWDVCKHCGVEVQVL